MGSYHNSIHFTNNNNNNSKNNKKTGKTEKKITLN